MNKLLKISLLVLLFVLLVLSGFFFFIFSQTGNEMLKPYVKQRLEKNLGMPVEVNRFKLEPGKSTLDFVVNKQAVVNVMSQFDLWGESFEGIYRIRAEHFSYNDIAFKKADLKGDFKGREEEIYVDGQGMLLDGKIDYRLSIIDDVAQKIIVNIKGAELAEVLLLNGQPALAHGKIDVNINMPNIGEDTATGDGHIVLNKAYFDRQLVQVLHHYTLPENSFVSGTIDTTLAGKNIQLHGDVQSNLFILKLTNGLIDSVEKKFFTDYSLDVKDMRILTQNKLEGPFKVDGKIEREDKKTRLSAKSGSLGGTLQLLMEDAVKITFEKLSLAKLLPLLKQPDYANGEVSGAIVLDDKHRESGKYDLHIDNGVLKPGALKDMTRYNIPADNAFSLKAKGDIVKNQLKGNVTIKSTLADATFTSVEYDLKEKGMVSDYDLMIHNVNALIPEAHLAKTMPVRAEGTFNYKERLSISGMMKGVGEKVSFSYDSQRAKVDAPKLFVEKILALAGLPVYAKGTVDLQLDFKSMKPSQGNFQLKSNSLVTDPQEMKKLTGEALEANIAFDSSGTFKDGVGYIDTNIKSPLGNISLPDMVYDAESKSVKSSYIIDLPELRRLQKVIDRKLYGPLVLKGDFSTGNVLNMKGTTQTLGGNIDYSLVGDNLNSTIENVPLENILGLLGHKKDFLGKAYGKGKYHLKSKAGTVDLDIKSFQIKPSSTTQTIKMVIGKDPARVIFSSTKFHADIKGKVTAYTLHAVGSRSSIDITEGRIDKINNTNTAKLKFVYEEYTLYGKIQGSIDDPKVTVDTSALFQDKIEGKLQKKIEKALGGKAGDLLKNLKF